MKILAKIFFIFCISNKTLLAHRYNYDGIDCTRIHNYPKNYAKDCMETKPFSGPSQWRYVPSLGYRKFSDFGAARRDWLNYRYWWKNYYYNW